MYLCNVFYYYHYDIIDIIRILKMYDHKFHQWICRLFLMLLLCFYILSKRISKGLRFIFHKLSVCGGKCDRISYTRCSYTL